MMVFWLVISPVLEDIHLELFFDNVREFHPGVRKQLHTVVLKWIVRGGDHHAGLKIILANKTSHARSGDHSCEGHRRTSLRESRSQDRSDGRAGFASVHADKNLSGAVFAPAIPPQTPSTAKHDAFAHCTT